MTIKSTFLWTSVHTLIKILSGIVMNKVVAVYLGPSGLALLGQFQNFSQLVVNIASGSIHSGIVKYTAEHSTSKEELNKLWSNALLLTLCLSVGMFLAVVFFSNYLAHEVLFSYEYRYVMIVFGFSIFLYVLNMYVLAVINGLQNIRLYTTINILISILTLIAVTTLTINYKMMGALYAFILTQSVVFGITFWLMYREYKLEFFCMRWPIQGYNGAVVKRLLEYGSVSFVSGVSMSIMLLAVRSIIQQDLSLEYAGYWEALWKISVYFTMVSMLPAGIYYLPKYSAMKSVEEIKAGLFESVKFFLPLQLLLGIFVYYFRVDIVSLLFTDEFLVITSVLLIMLVGDIIKVAAYLIINIMYAKKFTKKIILFDILYNIIFILLVYVSFHDYGLMGLVWSYLAVNIMGLIYVLFFYFSMERFLKKA